MGEDGRAGPHREPGAEGLGIPGSWLCEVALWMTGGCLSLGPQFPHPGGEQRGEWLEEDQRNALESSSQPESPGGLVKVSITQILIQQV